MSLPEYRLQPVHFANISLSEVQGSWPAATPATQQLRYRLIESFINNCTEPRKGTLVMADELRGLYNQFISPAWKAKDRYSSGVHFNRNCQAQDAGTTYPLHSGWLLAVAAFNAGPRAIDALAYYNGWNEADMNNPQLIASFTPDQITPSLYWAGKYNPDTDLIDFASQTGVKLEWPWFKGCVVQRHVARVMQNVTLLPEFFVDSLEGNYPCAMSTFDRNGKLIKSGVPPFRQTSSGVKPKN